MNINTLLKRLPSKSFPKNSEMNPQFSFQVLSFLFQLFTLCRIKKQCPSPRHSLKCTQSSKGSIQWPTKPFWQHRPWALSWAWHNAAATQVQALLLVSECCHFMVTLKLTSDHGPFKGVLVLRFYIPVQRMSLAAATFVLYSGLSAFIPFC